MAFFQRICLVHYHEIGLKGHNRNDFEKRLSKNITQLLSAYPLVTIHIIAGRLCIFLKEGTTFEESCQIADLIARIPGVARVSSGFKCSRDVEEMKQAAIQTAQDAMPFASFRITARRNHTDFPICSMDMNVLFGDTVAEAFPHARVQMRDADLDLHVEVVQNATYLYGRSIPGIGGLPVGSAGKVMCLMSSGIDSPVAAWRIARRGAVCIGVHFSGRPMTEDTSEYLVDEIAHVLEKTGCFARLYVVPLGEYQHQIALVAPSSLRIILYRRLMYKVAEQLALKEFAGALVTGESLGQVASQTLENIAATDDAVTLPVFRPLIGTDKLEIITMAQQLGTFDISSQPAPDCCTLYMPKTPETHAKLDAVHEAEALYPLDEWVAELVQAAEVHEYNCPACRPLKQSSSKQGF